VVYRLQDMSAPSLLFRDRVTEHRRSALNVQGQWPAGCVPYLRCRVPAARLAVAGCGPGCRLLGGRVVRVPLCAVAQCRRLPLVTLCGCGWGCAGVVHVQVSTPMTCRRARGVDVDVDEPDYSSS
jgi:hypothetical protein